MKENLNKMKSSIQLWKIHCPAVSLQTSFSFCFEILLVTLLNLDNIKLLDPPSTSFLMQNFVQGEVFKAF